MKAIGAAELEDSLKTGFLDQYHPSKEDLRPKLLINNSDRGQKVLTSIISELQNSWSNSIHC